MLDCWMAWTERYTIEMAEMMAPYRVYWMEEVLQPHDYAGLRAAEQPDQVAHASPPASTSTARYGFRQLLEQQAAASGSPTSNGAAALTECGESRALAAAYDISGDPARRRRHGTASISSWRRQRPWAELFMPAPGGPKEVYDLRGREQDHAGPEGIYVRPSTRLALDGTFW